MRVSHFPAIVRLVILILPCTLVTAAKDLPSKAAYLNEPYAEWSLRHRIESGNPFDVEASATFTHEGGEVYRSLLFYAGEDSWKFRFTGTKLGEWKVQTEGPGELGGWEGSIAILPNPKVRNGFMKGIAGRWVWQGSGRQTVPQLAMGKTPEKYWGHRQVDIAAIEADLTEFIDDHGFTGVHIPSVAGRWFNLEEESTFDEQGNPIDEQNPDFRTYRILEEFLTRAYRKGAMTHIWLWGSGVLQWNFREGPEGIGGPLSVTDKRNLRYIAARLGPIPGWNMGYAFDIGLPLNDPDPYADAEELQAWYTFLKGALHQWDHLIGARADSQDHLMKNRQDIFEEHRPFDDVYWIGDYVGLYDYRPAYAWYVKSLEFAGDKPCFQEDRFRIREHRRWKFKDYTPEMTLRGLWHSMMAGGVGNIWGVLIPYEESAGSDPYDSGAAGEVEGRQFRIEMKEAIQSWADFWFEQDRILPDWIRANALTGNEPGPDILPHEGGYISVGLRDPDFRRFIFYSEETRGLRIDLRNMKGAQKAIAVDVRGLGKEIPLGYLSPKLYENLELPHTSHWAVAVGDF